MLAFQASTLGSNLGLGSSFKEFFPCKLIFMKKFFKNFQNILIKKFFFDLSRQCIYLQLKKPSGIEIEMPIQNKLAID